MINVIDADVVEFMNKFKESPLKIIRTYSYDVFLDFLDGYLYRETENSESIQLIKKFKNYICKYFDVYNTKCNELMLLKYYTVSDDQAFNLLFDLFENFIKGNIYPEYNKNQINQQSFHNKHLDLKSNPLLDCLIRVKNQPAFVGTPPSFYRLSEILSMNCQNNRNVSEFMYKLSIFLFDHYQLPNAPRPSITIINLFTESDEEAFYKFFELFDEFIATNRIEE